MIDPVTAVDPINVGAGLLPEDRGSFDLLMTAVKQTEDHLQTKAQAFCLFDSANHFWEGWAVAGGSTTTSGLTPVVIFVMANSLPPMLFAFVMFVDLTKGMHAWPQRRREGKVVVGSPSKHVMRVVKAKAQIKTLLHGTEVSEVVPKALSYLRRMVKKYPNGPDV